jgi:ABC-type nitrate/sulfonate/bicarbonate transport system ATPase subunit
MWNIIISPYEYNAMRRNRDFSKLDKALKNQGAKEGDHVSILGDSGVGKGNVKINGVMIKYNSETQGGSK